MTTAPSTSTAHSSRPHTSSNHDLNANRPSSSTMPLAEDVRNGRKARLHLVATPSESALLGSGGGGLWDTAQRFWRKSYAGDYLGLAILLAGFLVVKNLSEPFYQTFVVNDVRISHPFAMVQRVPACEFFHRFYTTYISRGWSPGVGQAGKANVVCGLTSSGWKTACSGER